MDLTVREVARLLGTSENTVYRWIHDGSLPGYRVNDKYRLNRVELLEWATARNLKVSPEIFEGETPTPVRPPLADALKVGGVLYDVAGADKASALKSLCAQLPVPEGVNRDDLYGVLLAREALGSTGIGKGVAIPHPRSPLILRVPRPAVTLAFLQQPVDFHALDGQPVNILFTIISTTNRVHLQFLSRLMHSLQDETFLKLLHERASADAIVEQLAVIEHTLGGGQ